MGEWTVGARAQDLGAGQSRWRPRCPAACGISAAGIPSTSAPRVYSARPAGSSADSGDIRLLRARRQCRHLLLPGLLVPPLRSLLVPGARIQRPLGLRPRPSCATGVLHPASRLAARSPRLSPHTPPRAAEKLAAMGTGTTLGRASQAVRCPFSARI